MKTMAAVAVILALSLACAGGGETTGGTPAPSIVHPTEPPFATPCQLSDPTCVTPEPEQGDLSPEQMEEAKRIAEQDSVLADLLDTANYSINVGPYRAQFGGIPGTFVSMEYALEESLDVDHDLPHLDTGYRGGEENPTQIALPSPGYEVNVSHNEIEAWSLMVIVLLEEEQVVEILPLPFGPGNNPSAGPP